MKKTILAAIALAITSFAHAGGASVQSTQELPVCSPKVPCKVDISESKTPGVFEISVKTIDGKPAVPDVALMAMLKKAPNGKASLEATW